MPHTLSLTHADQCECEFGPSGQPSRAPSARPRADAALVQLLRRRALSGRQRSGRRRRAGMGPGGLRLLLQVGRQGREMRSRRHAAGAGLDHRSMCGGSGRQRQCGSRQHGRCGLGGGWARRMAASRLRPSIAIGARVGVARAAGAKSSTVHSAAAAATDTSAKASAAASAYTLALSRSVGSGRRLLLRCCHGGAQQRTGRIEGARRRGRRVIGRRSLMGRAVTRRRGWT